MRGGREPGPAWIGMAFTAAAAFLTLVFYRDFVFHPGRALFGTDMVIEGFPLRRFAVDEVRAGHGLPMWNPFVYGGLPFVATLPGPVYYPSTLLYLMLPLHRAIGWTFVLHTFLAGGCAYFGARSFRLSRPASCVTGFAFLFSGYLLSTLYGGHDGRMFAIVLVPLVFGMLERALQTGRGTWFVGAVLALSLQIFTPHTQVMYYSSLWLLAWAAWRIGFLARDSRPARSVVTDRAVGVVAVFLLAACVSAVQLFPTYELLPHVSRAAQETGYPFAASWAVPAAEVTALLLPDLFGSLGTYWGTNPFKLHTEFLGALPLALAAVAVAGAMVRGRPVEERRWIGFFAVAALVSVLFALGSATPVHRAAYEFVPFVRSFRAPSLMLGPATFFVSLLAGAGWERIRRADSTFPWFPVLLLSVPPLALGLAAALAPGGLLDFVYHSWLPPGWPRRPPVELEGALRAGGWWVLVLWGGVLVTARARAGGRVGEWVLVPLLLLGIADLWRVDVRYLRTVEADDLFRRDAAIETMREQSLPGERVLPLEGSYESNELMFFGIPSVPGTQKFMLSWFRDLVGGVRYANLGNPALWQLFDVRWVTLRSETEIPILRPVELESAGEGAGGGEGAERTRLYEFTLETPHAFFPSTVLPVDGTAEAVQRTIQLSDPRAEAVVEPEEGLPAPRAGEGSARVTRWEADEVVFGAEVTRPGLLFVSEIWAPGWQASVDGRPVPVYRVNAAFRGVSVPAGRHEVRFRYEAPGHRWGVRVSVVGLLLCAGLFGWSVRRERSERNRVGSGEEPPTRSAGEGP